MRMVYVVVCVCFFGLPLMGAQQAKQPTTAADAASREASYDPDRRRQEPPEALAAGMSAWELHSRANTTAAAGGRRA